MHGSRRSFLASVAFIALPAVVVAAKRQPRTAVYVKDMHCQACAKKIAGKLYTVPGVVKVQTDVAKGLAVITHQANKVPSPKLLWEAVEAATFKPIKVASPLGTFLKKPRR